MNVKSKDLTFFLYVRKRLHTFCTPFAHLPESGAFLRKVCTACFPLHKKSLVGARPLHLAGARPFGHSKAPLGLLLLRKRESFMQTELSSTPCVRLRPSAGWLQGSPYRRFLLPPGSDLGNRSWLRFSRSTPAGVCRNSTCLPGCWCRCAIPGNSSCCCTDGNFSKKREGWTVPALLTEPNIKGSEIFSKN